MANSPIYIVYQHHRLISSAAHRTQILHIGDFFIQFTAKRTQQTFLLLCELSENVAAFNANFRLNFSERLSGSFTALLM